MAVCAVAGHERAGRGERGAGAGRAGPRHARLGPLRAGHRAQARPLDCKPYTIDPQVQAALDRAMRASGRSVLVIAHRRAP